MSRVGFIGLGAMGLPMVRRLRDAGFDVRAFDVNAAMAAELPGIFASSLAEAGRERDIIVTMLPNGSIVRDALLGDAGALSEAAPGTIVIDMSSSDPFGTVELSKALAERGFTLIDAPVSGGVPGAEEGKLSIMIGCDDAKAREACQPVLAALGAKFFDVGPVGAGHAAKAINNVTAASVAAVTSEGVIAARRFGIEPETMIEVLNASTGGSFVSRMLFPGAILSQKFNAGFALALMAKDVALAAGIGERLSLELPMIQTANAQWSAARDELGGQSDFSKYFLYIEGKNGGSASEPN